MDYQDIIANFQAQQAAAKAANEARYAESLEIYDEIIKQYQPEGGFLTGAQQELEREKGRTVAGQEQKLVSSGLFGTSVTAGLGSKWESEVGMPARLKLEDVRMGRLAEALQSKAGAIERRDDVGPDYATIAALSQQAGSRPTQMYQQAPQTTESGPSPWDPDFLGGGFGVSSPFGQSGVGAVYTPPRDAGRTGTTQTTAQPTQTPQQYWAGAQEFGAGTSQLSQDIFSAMSGYASQAGSQIAQGVGTASKSLEQITAENDAIYRARKKAEKEAQGLTVPW